MEQQTISLAKVPIIIFENIESKLASREECWEHYKHVVQS
jgi:hypothetical protein